MQQPEENEFWKGLPDEILSSIVDAPTVTTDPAAVSFDAPTIAATTTLSVAPAFIPEELMQVMRGTIEAAERFQAEHEGYMANIAQTQLSALVPGGIFGRMKQTIDGIEQSCTELQRMLRTAVLDHITLHKARQLLTSLNILRVKCDLILQQAAPNSSPVALAIKDQPLPQVVFKGKVIDPYAVQVITLPGWKEKSHSKMQAVLCAEDLPVGTTVPVSPVENDTARVDTYQRVALFNDLKLALSTRMTPVFLKFSLTLQATSGHAITTESKRSRAIIVITNESQWSDAYGKLVLADAFGDMPELTWPLFANTLHAHVLSATRQEVARPSRPLGEGDWLYIRSKFFDNLPTVRQTQATAFWQFFGPALASIRFKRHINALWFAGLILGFATKETCTAILAMQEVGTFVIRFSESSPGLFTVAYVSDDPFERIKHYLVKQEDLSLNKTLPDLVREKPQFNHVLQLDLQTGALRRYPRDAVFAAYYSKNRKMPTTGNSSGYVAL